MQVNLVPFCVYKTIRNLEIYKKRIAICVLRRSFDTPFLKLFKVLEMMKFLFRQKSIWLIFIIVLHCTASPSKGEKGTKATTSSKATKSGQPKKEVRIISNPL